jgi:long-chain acyl-CoA synthetase
VAFVENLRVLDSVLSAADGLPSLRRVIVMEELPLLPGEFAAKASAAGVTLHRLADLEAEGAKLRGAGTKVAEERIAGIRGDDLFTIIYTSGTTGTPKGVRLTHEAMASQVRNLPFVLTPEDRCLSILPVWHSYERVFEVISIASGLETSYTSLRHLGPDLLSVRPTIMVSAPRLWEGLYQKIMAGIGKASPVSRCLLLASLFCAHGVRTARSFFGGQELDLVGRRGATTLFLALRHALTWLACFLPWVVLDRVILSKLRAVTGGALRGTISGGGALPPHVDAFFNDLGIPVLEGYGLTESCPVLAVRTWERLVIGTVGPPFPGPDIRIVDPSTGTLIWPDPSRPDAGCGLRGEIQARGPQIMQGYHKDPEGTGRVLRGGWLSTGDLGIMTFNGCLKIVGRCKETIVLLGGENVEPLPIESRLLESPLIDQCMVVGQDRKHLGALIVPSLEGFAAAGIASPDLRTLAGMGAARELVRSEIRRLAGAEAGFKPFERVTVLELLPKPFEVGDELTPTYKLRRHVIAGKYSGEIDGLFAG